MKKIKHIKKVISKDKAKLCFDYICLRKNVFNTIGADKSFLHEIFGRPGDKLLPKAYAIYCDPLIDLLSIECKPYVEKYLNKKLFQTFSYVRVHTKGDELKPHVDRGACETAVSMFLGGDRWPFYIDGKEINLEVGDMIIYNGVALKHWRKKFTKKISAQACFFYSKKKQREFDGKPHIGLPFDFSTDPDKLRYGGN
tara:strand:+ start:2856 stop:3446 length:591 start_codon:yes stop_codon:yes gene_type:complete